MYARIAALIITVALKLIINKLVVEFVRNNLDEEAAIAALNLNKTVE